MGDLLAGRQSIFKLDLCHLLAALELETAAQVHVTLGKILLLLVLGAALLCLSQFKIDEGVRAMLLPHGHQTVVYLFQKVLHVDRGTTRGGVLVQVLVHLAVVQQ